MLALPVLSHHPSGALAFHRDGCVMLPELLRRWEVVILPFRHDK